jgi:hypothetical protein
MWHQQPSLGSWKFSHLSQFCSVQIAQFPKRTVGNADL